MKDLVLLNIVAGCALLGIMVILPYLKRRNNFLMSSNALATGIERPLWGPLFKLDTDTLTYQELKNLHIDPFVTYSNEIGNLRSKRKTIPYESNKI